MLLLDTGRELGDLQTVFPEISVFFQGVAENRQSSIVSLILA